MLHTLLLISYDGNGICTIYSGSLNDCIIKKESMCSYLESAYYVIIKGNVYDYLDKVRSLKIYNR